jgi:acetyl-CoA C-acetyltransferase
MMRWMLVSKNTDVVIIGAARTPIGRYGGSLAGVRPDDLAALVLASVVARAGLDPALVDDVILGAANQAGEDNRNVARMAVLLAGLPDSVPGMTVNRLCASGLSAVHLASMMVKSGEADVVIAGGVESMTRAPWVLAKPEKAFGKPGEIVDTSIGWRFTNERMLDRENATYSMPETAEEVATREGISRQDADAFAVDSHRRAVAAVDGGVFDAEIAGVPTRAGTVLRDEGPRPDTTLEALARLRSVVRPGGIVTAGNASSLNDGAAAIIVASESAVQRLGLRPRARVLGGASAGVAPEVMGLGPVPATQKLLGRLGLAVGDLDAVELNEAFATQSLACIRLLGLDPDIVNRNGGAIALGHPLGASGTRILVTLLGRMEREGAKRGLATMCVGVGQGASLLVEAVA